MMKRTLLGLVISTIFLPSISNAANGSLLFNKAWTYSHASLQNPGFLSEISAFDSATNSIWVGGVTGVDILDLATGTKTGAIDLTPFGSINSVAIHNGVAAFAIENDVRTSPGFVQFYNTGTKNIVKQVTVGALPDMVKFTPDGSKLLVANEGTPDTYGDEVGNSTPKVFGPAPNDPVGTVSVIDTSNINNAQVVATAGFSGVTETGSNIRKNTGMDFEPEYIAVNQAGTKAFVTLQEANAVGILDLSTNSFEKVVGLGAKDFSLPGNTIDPSDRDGINFGSHNIKGLYMPDGIESFESNGQTFMIMANEGDLREDDGDRASRGEFSANPADPDLNRIRLSNTDSSDGNLFAPGGRSFSIRDENGNIVYDSGDELDRFAADLGIYNDGRSDDKGVEPEGVTLLDIAGAKYAFIGLERTTTSAIAVYDITDPFNSSFVDMIVSDGDVSPEGIQAFVSGGVNYLSISNEVSNTTSLYRVSAVPEPSTYAMLLVGLLFIATRRKQQS